MSRMPDVHSVTSCPQAEDAVAVALGQIALEEREAIQRHLNACRVCARIAADTRRVVEKLRRRPAETVRCDLAPVLLARIPADAWQTPLGTKVPLWAPRVLLVAAMLMLMLGGIWIMAKRVAPAPSAPVASAPAEARPPSAPPLDARREAIRSALDWLVFAQESSGAWAPERWQGKPEYEVSLTGMALLALLQEPAGSLRADRQDAVRRGLAYLTARQHANGTWEPEGTAQMYNHALATLALLEAWRVRHEPPLRDASDRALRFSLSQQHDSGGWGYQKGPGQAANTSITVWHLRTLLTARQAGWQGLEASLRKGLVWLRTMMDEQGYFGYQRPRDAPEGGNETLTAMGALCFFLAGREGADPQGSDARLRFALRVAASNPGAQPDYYRWYFVASALSAGADRGYPELLATLHTTLLRGQNRGPTHAGSWEPVDRWSTAGGRLYTTTMATLALEEDIAGHETTL